MNISSEKLTVFLAMPGTNLGPNANWKRPADVIRFFKKVCRSLEKRLKRQVTLEIEKERLQAGVIYKTMFSAAFEADIFIADLTGANPNVFLELGVRYALRRGITLLVSQGEETPPFNVEHLRVIRYANRTDDQVIDDIFRYIQNAIRQEHYNDSPVLEVLDLKTVRRDVWEKVYGERTQKLIHAAEQAISSKEIAQLFHEVLEIDPLHLDARIKFARWLRETDQFSEALKILEKGITLDARQARLHQERGVLLAACRTNPAPMG